MSDLRQGDLFSPALAEALAARDAALRQVAERAERECPDFAERARAVILARLASHGPQSVEDLTDCCIAAGVVPPDLRSFGPVILSLSRAGLIVKAGTCVRRRGHGTSGGNVWALREAPSARLAQ